MGVQPNDLDRLKNDKGKKPMETWVIYAGTLGSNYDIATIVRAARLLASRPESKRVRMLVAGDGPLRRFLVDSIARDQLGNLRYLGRLAPEELVRYYQVCDVGLCAYGPDSNVAMPDKGYDYMAAGLAIASSLTGEFERLLLRHSIGLHYAGGDAVSLANVLTALAQDEKSRREMGARAYELALRFDKNVQYPRFSEVVESLDQGVLSTH